MNVLALLIGILGLITITLLIIVMKLYKKIANLTKGKDATSLEGVISENNRLALEIKSKLKNQELQIVEIKKDSMKNVQNVGVIRFNPFKETGGSQSFAIALTDKKKNGVVISSLYARERINVFAKPLVNGESTYTLTDEEKSAIAQSHE